MKDYILRKVKDFDLEQTLECGQCFHYVKFGAQHYGISARGHFLEISQEEEQVIFHNITENEYLGIWKDYFDMERDYGAIKRILLEKDGRLSEAVESLGGVHILNQDFFETLISFILSQNNHIPRIKQLVAALSKNYGTYLCTCHGEDFFTFPEAKTLMQISEEELRAARTGFRAPYILDACRLVEQREICPERIQKMCDEEARRYLMKIKGVGEKVANCVLLFGAGRRSAFPVDVWIKRIMEEVYFQKAASKEDIMLWAEEIFGEYGGYAQQYLFYYGKKMKIGANYKKK